MADSQVTLQVLFSINGVPTLIDLYAVTDGAGNYTLESQPRTNGQPVSTADPMPVIDPAAITELTAIAANVASGATSALQATGNTTLAAILTDVAATAAGGATAALQSAGNASLTTVAAGTGTGATGITQLTGGTGTLGWLSGLFAGVGTTVDAAWASGAGTVVALLKNIATKLAGTLTVTSTTPPIVGFGGLTLAANTSTALSTVSLGPTSAAWPGSPGLVFVLNTGPNPASFAALGGTAAVANCIPVLAGGSYGFFKPSTAMTGFSTLGTTLIIQW